MTPPFNDASFKCPQCDSQFSYLKNLKRHIKSKHEKHNHLCQYCDKVFFRIDHLQRHLRNHSGQSNIKTVTEQPGPSNIHDDKQVRPSNVQYVHSSFQDSHPQPAPLNIPYNNQARPSNVQDAYSSFQDSHSQPGPSNIHDDNQARPITKDDSTHFHTTVCNKIIRPPKISLILILH